MIKLVATDIDGTILPNSLKFSNKVKTCIKDLQNKGIKVVLITGRMFAAARQLANELGLNTPVVAYQGGLIMKNANSNEILYKSYIPENDAKNILNWAKNNNVHLNFYTNDTLYSEIENETIKRYSEYQKVPYHIANFDSLDFSAINKILAIDYSNEKRVTEWINDRQKAFPHLYIIKSSPYFCEFSTKDATKAKAVEFLKKYWDLKDDEILTIGDQNNDIELLKAGGISVAMGNATDELKQYADYITDTVDNDGFVKAMEHFISGEIYV